MEIAGADAELPEIRRRARIFALIAMLVFAIIGARLFYLQVIEGDAFYRLTSDSIIRTTALPAVRGEIRDRKNRVLARMRPSANVSLLPRETTPESFERLRSVLALAPDEAAELWDRVQNDRADPARDQVRDRDRQIPVREDISRNAQAVLEETATDLPGVRLDHAIRRDYPFGPVAPHVLGYMNEISGEELRTKKQDGYRAGDLIGRIGIERQLEGYLRGRAGFDKQVVDRRGIPKGNIHELVEGAVRQDPIPGNNVFLTLDVDLQKIAERAFRNVNAGGAAVLDVSTGRILAMVSKPGFDPNEMSGHLSPEAQARIVADRFHPLRDKVLTETYFPGSTFKVVSALAALEDKLVTPDERVKCHGSFEIGRRRFKCTKTHGVVGLYEAIVQSCNVYFYDLGARPGMLDRLNRFATDMGLGAPSGLGLNGEESGFMPNEEWYREQKRQDPKAEGFQVGHALNAAIGQGSTRVTLMQMVTMYAAIANGGKLWLPQIVERIESPSGQVIEEFAPRVRRELAISPENLTTVRQALVGVVNESKGTAYKARIDDDVEIAGKTGTAQVRRFTRRGEPVASYEQNDHAWFVGFAPAGNPRIAFAVLVEHGGHGGEIAAPIAMEISHGYFESVAPGDRVAPRVGLQRHKYSAGLAARTPGTELGGPAPIRTSGTTHAAEAAGETQSQGAAPEGGGGAGPPEAHPPSERPATPPRTAPSDTATPGSP
jgi:penicillin-binding protein 2